MLIATDKRAVSFQNVRSLDVVLKVSERCNLNCDYCYFFNAGDDSYKDHAAFIANETVALILRRLREFSLHRELEQVAVHLHGGEPLLMPKKRFDHICNEIRSILAPIVDLSITVQTNGTLIDRDWIEIFNRHGVMVGVSLDGTKDHNDARRLDHRGRSSYETTIRGLALCREHLDQPPGVLTVVGEDFDAREIYLHFRQGLRIDNLDFLLPDWNHDNFNGEAEAYGDFLIKVFDMMVEDDTPVRVRIIDHFLASIYGQRNFLFGSGGADPEYLLLTISSDGGVGPDDTLRSTKFWNGHNYRALADSSIEEILEDPVFHELEHAMKTPAAACSNCCWRKVCGGGQSVHRYSTSNGFDNPSVYCQGLDKFYTHVVKHLTLHGEPLEKTGAHLV